MRVKTIKTLSLDHEISMNSTSTSLIRISLFMSYLTLQFLHGLIEAVNEHLLLADIGDLLVEILLELLDPLELES